MKVGCHLAADKLVSVMATNSLISWATL